jgi:hypothetical protein
MGLVPVLVAGLEDDPKRPWDSGEFIPTDPRRVQSIDAVETLANAWRESLDEESLGPVEPFGIDFPELLHRHVLLMAPVTRMCSRT